MTATSRKRYIDTVDLTVDDGLRETSEKPRKVSRSNAAGLQSSSVRAGVSTPNQSQTAIQVDEDDENYAEELADGSQAAEDAYTSYQLYGVLHTKIVGVRYYRGEANVGECVTVHREPDNPYDRNAIRILNVMGDMIGHVPRQQAARLASYMDSKELLVDGTLAGEKGAFDCPLDLKLFGTSDPQEQTKLMDKMLADKLPIAVVRGSHREKLRLQAKEQKERAKQQAQRARAEKLAKSKGQFTSMAIAQGNEVPGPDFDELIGQSISFNPREMSNVVEKFGADETELAKMPLAECPAALSTELLPYQRQGLAWMLEKESPKLPGAGSEDVVQLWKRAGGSYKNIATNYSTSVPPPLASGGILADDMGLGKTLQVISLILANPSPMTVESAKTTLIISPLGVMSNWRDQIAQHIKAAKALRVLIYHGQSKKEKAKELDQYDVVITTYGALASEFPGTDDQGTQKQQKKTKARSGLFSIRWRRVVLDEGHTIRTPQTKGARAACGLEADSRWSLTGTPIVNNLKDLYSQVKFLGLSGGLQDFPVFNSALIRPLNAGDPSANLVLQALMGTFCLRRKKEMNFVNLKLPPMSSHILHAKFQAHEREKYDMLMSEAQGVLQQYTSRDNQKGATTYSHLLEVLLRLRQVCNHWALCQNRIANLTAQLEKSKVVSLTPENVKALQTALQLSIENQETCPVCLDVLDSPVITACAHVFDHACIEQVIQRQHKCPMCRADIEDTSDLVSPAADLGEDTGMSDINPESASSKIEALLKILTAQGQTEGTKTVVFSQWTAFLDLVEPHLAKHNIKFARVDGTMTSTKRDAAIAMLTNDPECTVMLASLNVCSVGLNLVAANQVILADSWWAPAIEDQAVDRVYRLGQKRPTTVWRLVMEGSIEDKVLEIQKRKRELMTTAFREKTTKKGDDRRTTMADLETLLK